MDFVRTLAEVWLRQLGALLLWPFVLGALLHLLEIRYNERIVFWNGALQITLEDAAKLGAVFASPAMVRLPDGRTGTLQITHSHTMPGYCEIAGSGNPNE